MFTTAATARTQTLWKAIQQTTYLLTLWSKVCRCSVGGGYKVKFDIRYVQLAKNMALCGALI